jgi:hypothetical protein
MTRTICVLIALVLAAPTAVASAQTVATGQCHTASVEWPRGTVLFVAAADGTGCEIAMSVDCRRRNGRVWSMHRTGWVDDGHLEAWRVRCGRRADATGHRIDGFPLVP